MAKYRKNDLAIRSHCRPELFRGTWLDQKSLLKSLSNGKKHWRGGGKYIECNFHPLARERERESGIITTCGYDDSLKFWSHWLKAFVAIWIALAREFHPIRPFKTTQWMLKANWTAMNSQLAATTTAATTTITTCHEYLQKLFKPSTEKRWCPFFFRVLNLFEL